MIGYGTLLTRTLPITTVSSEAFHITSHGEPPAFLFLFFFFIRLNLVCGRFLCALFVGSALRNVCWAMGHPRIWRLRIPLEVVRGFGETRIFLEKGQGISLGRNSCFVG